MPCRLRRSTTPSNATWSAASRPAPSRAESIEGHPMASVSFRNIRKSFGKVHIIHERVVNDLESKDRDIAMVFQSYALYPHMTVGQNMGFGLRLRKVDKSEID